jgi:UDPglucose--hexose-1-phosphate uridylyltransferase
MSQYRYDPLSNEWVVIAAERLKRPNIESPEFSLIKEDVCPFCEGKEWLTPGEIYAYSLQSRRKNSTRWMTRVVPNLYKAVAVESDPFFVQKGLFEEAAGFGAHEIIIDTPKHDARFDTLSEEEVFAYLTTLQLRIRDLRTDNRIQYVQLFKNSGPNAGATMEHPHTQLIAMPFVPPRVADTFARERDFFEKNREPLLIGQLRQTLEEQERVVAENGEFVLYAPYASRFPFELSITPRSALKSIADCSEAQLGSLAEILRTAFRSLHGLLGKSAAYNLLFKEIPFNLGYSPEQEEGSVFTLQIVPRIYQMGGYELSTSVMINPVEPEYASKLYREKLL